MAPKEVHPDEDVRIRSDTGWYKRVLDALNVHVTTGVPCTHTSNPLCERQNRVLEYNLRVLMKQGGTKDWVCLLPWAVLTMNSEESSSTGYMPHELYHGGRPVWFFKTPFPEDYKSLVGEWLEHRQDLANLARANLKHIRERELTSRSHTRRLATLKVGDLVLAHHSRLPTRPRNCLLDPYFGPYRIIKIDGSRIHVRCGPRLGGELLCAPKQLRHYHSPDKLTWDECRLSDRDVQRIHLENAANLEEAHQLEEMTADEMPVDGYYVVAAIASDEYKQSRKFLTPSDGYGLSEANWEPMFAIIQPDGSINPIFRFYSVGNHEGQLLTLAETLSQRKKKNESPCAYLFTALSPPRGAEHSRAEKLGLLSVWQNTFTTPVELQFRSMHLLPPSIGFGTADTYTSAACGVLHLPWLCPAVPCLWLPA